MLYKKSHTYFVLLAFYLFFILLLFFDFISYELWAQVKDYRYNYVLNGGFYINQHFIRYLLIHPVYLAVDLFGFELNKAYGFYVITTALLVSFFWWKTRVCISKEETGDKLFLIVPFLLLFFVNGRFIFALLGLSLILFFIIRAKVSGISFGGVVFLMLGFVYVSVSSGVLLVGSIFFVLSMCFLFRFKSLFDFSFGGFFSVFIFLAFSSYLVSFIHKNLYFYASAGNVFEILTHGFGFIFFAKSLSYTCIDSGLYCYVVSYLSSLSFGCLILVYFSILLSVIYFLNVFFKYYESEFVKIGILTSIFAGFFGFTAFMSIFFIVPILVNRKNIKDLFVN